VLDCNPAARSLLGVVAERTDLFSLPADPREGQRLFADLSAAGCVRGREIEMVRPDGSACLVRLSAALARASDGAVRRLEVLACDLTDLRRQERRREELLAEQETSSFLLSRPLASVARRVPLVDLESSVHEAAARMTRAKTDCLLVAGPSGQPLGVLTDRDLRERVLGAQADPGRPVREFMSSPLVWAPDGALVYEAVLLMRERGVSHLLVREAGESRIVAALDLLQLQRHSPAVLVREIAAAGSVEQVADCRAGVLELVRGLSGSGAGHRGVIRVFNTLADRMLERLIALAAAELGPPPAPFALLALGSEGRQERTLGSDQDSAILFDDSATGQRSWFLQLGASVCAALEAMGVPRCAGGAMADNPAWCLGLEEWQERFARWIREPEPRELLDFNIVFDLRAAAGEEPLAARLRAEVAALLEGNPPFFLHHARDVRERRLPVVHKGRLDAKEAMAFIVAFSRLYALKHGEPALGTHERLEALRDKGVLEGRLVGETLRAYDLLGRLRLEAQLAGAGNVVDTASLAHADQTLLKESLALLSLLQKRIGFDFLGG
jgi:CBS domain-containing protein